MPSDDSIPLDEAGEVTLPIVEVLTGRAFITGKSGSGKSTTASVVAEELLDRGFPLMVIDVEGEYWGLKEQYEVLHVGADEECDLRVGPEHGEKLADLALEQGVPIILDVSGYLDADGGDALVRETARHLFDQQKKLNRPFLLLIEEIHEYIPEGAGLDDTGEMLVRVAKRGRKRGLGVAGLSQRPADVRKDFITQCDWLIWHRLTWDNDTEVVRSVVDREHAEAVQELGDGEGFLMADFLDHDIQRVQVRPKRTFDAGATPDLGEYERPELKGVDADLVSELEEISEREERRQDRIAELEQQVAERDETIADLEDELEQARDMTDMAEQFTEALTQSGNGDDALEQKVDEIREEKNTRIRELETERDQLQERVTALEADLSDARAELEELAEYRDAVENMGELREAVARMNEALGVDVDGDDDRLRQRLASKEERIEELETQVERLREEQTGVEPLEDYDEFLNARAVQAEIEAAKADKSPRYIKGVLAGILNERGPIPYETIAERLGVSTTTDISKAASELERRKIVTKDRRDGSMYVDLNLEGLNEVRVAAAEREKTEELMEQL